MRSDLTGDRDTSDVCCESGVPLAYGEPCLHNVAHAHAVGKEPNDLFHAKDRTETWKAQYPAVIALSTHCYLVNAIYKMP